MTNSPFGTGNLFDMLNEVGNIFGTQPGSGNYTYTKTTTTETPKEAGPKYKLVSDLGVGAELVRHDGATALVETLSRVGDDGSVEIVLSDNHSFVLLPNMKVQVK